VARNSVPPMPQIANMARTRITKKRKGAPAPPPLPNTKRARTKIVEGLARQKLLGAKTRKGAYGNHTKTVKEGRKVYPWLTYGQLKAKVARLKKAAATNLTDITNCGTVAPSSIIPTNAGRPVGSTRVDEATLEGKKQARLSSSERRKGKGCVQGLRSR
jgi:hypothetical protein